MSLQTAADKAARVTHNTMDKLLAMRHQNALRARRRLFQEDDNHTVQDNLANVLQESRIRDTNNMKAKWNFDFDKEEPLEGKYQWYKLDNETWVSVEPKSVKPVRETYYSIDVDVKSVKDFPNGFEKENQVTPKTNKVDVSVGARKRKREDVSNDKVDKGAKRKISFD